MLALVLSMLVITLVAGAVVAYVAYPHRGRELPAAPWLGDALRRGVDSLPTVAEEERDDAGVAVPAQRRVPGQRREVAPRDRG